MAARPRERLPLLSPLLAVFIVGAASVTLVPGWNIFVKVLGVVLAVFFVITSIRARIVPALEMILYLAWVTWSLTGVIGVISPLFFWTTWTTIFQIWGLLFIVSSYVVSRKTLSFCLGLLLLGFLIVAVYSYATGEYAAAEGPAGTRVAGLAMNANMFAWMMVLATVAMAYFWMLRTRLAWLKYPLLIAGMAAATVACVLSGSRTGLAGLVAFYPAWIWFCYRKHILRRPRVLAVVLAGVLVGGTLFTGYLIRSPAGERVRTGVRDLRTMGAAAPSVGIRLRLFMRAWDIFLDHPLTGVGLNNFRFHSGTGLVSHSEYPEIACTTGLPGFILYFAIFVVLWRRAGKIAKHSDDARAVTVAGFIRAVLVVVMLMNLGRWNYYDKAAWIVFGSFIGYTNAVWQSLKQRVYAPADALNQAAPSAGQGLVGTRGG